MNQNPERLVEEQKCIKEKCQICFEARRSSFVVRRSFAAFFASSVFSTQLCAEGLNPLAHTSFISLSPYHLVVLRFAERKHASQGCIAITSAGMWMLNGTGRVSEKRWLRKRIVKKGGPSRRRTPSSSPQFSPLPLKNIVIKQS